MNALVRLNCWLWLEYIQQYNQIASPPSPAQRPVAETSAHESEAGILYYILVGLPEISHHFAAGSQFSCCATSADAMVYPNYIAPV